MTICNHRDERRVRAKDGAEMVEHICPPCPHGKTKGYRMVPPLYPSLRRRWYAELDAMTCEDDHPGAREVHLAASA